MTREEAKFILTAYRANGIDRDEGVFSEALALARQDPELAAWLAREQRHDTEISRRLREVPTPDGLREAILAGVRASGGLPAPARRPLPWVLGATAIAATIALMFSLRPRELPLAPTAPPARPLLMGLESFVVNDALMAGGSHKGDWGDIAKSVQKMLSKPETRLRTNLKIDFDDLCATGARKIAFEGHNIIEICFVRKDTGLWYHLYVAQRADFPTLGSPGRLVDGNKEDVWFTFWCDELYHYVVAGPGDPEIGKHLF